MNAVKGSWLTAFANSARKIRTVEQFAAGLLIVLAILTCTLVWKEDGTGVGGWTVLIGFILVFTFLAYRAGMAATPPPQVDPYPCRMNSHREIVHELLQCERGKIKYTKVGHLSKLLKVESQELEGALRELSQCGTR